MGKQLWQSTACNTAEVGGENPSFLVTMGRRVRHHDRKERPLGSGSIPERSTKYEALSVHLRPPPNRRAPI